MYEGDQWEGLCISLNVEKFHVWEFFLLVCIGAIYFAELPEARGGCLIPRKDWGRWLLATS